MTINSYLSKRRVIFSLFFVIAGAFWIWISRLPSVIHNLDLIEAPQVGFKAPDFSLSTLSGDNFTLGETANSPIILNFWASWCPPCRTEMPDFQQAYLEFESQGLLFIAVNATNQDKLTDVISFTDQYQLTFPILLDQTGSTSRAYNIHSLPTTYFIDSQGIIKNILIGGPIPLSLLRIQANILLEENN